MKRIILILMFLVVIVPNSYAGLISVKTLSSDASVNDLNQNFSILEDEFNGNVDTDNILDDTISESDMSDNINPRVRDSEFFNDYTYTGHLPVTDTDLISDISAGTSYVEGYRVVTAATEKTYIASRDTWVYININGTFEYEVVVNDAAQPTEPSNSLLLAKVVTDTDNITSVTDHRTTDISIGSPEDFLIKGFYVLSADEEAVSIDPGIVYVGTTRVAKTTIIGLRASTATDWHDSVADGDPASTTWWYIGVSAAGNVKWLGATPPDYHDVSANTVGNLYYKKIGTTYWRIIGVVRMNADGHIDHMIQWGDTYMHGLPVSLTTTVSAGVWRGLDCSAGMPKIATKGIFGLMVYENDTGNDALIAIRPFGAAWAGFATGSTHGADRATSISIYDGGASDLHISGQRTCPSRVSSDTGQVIQYWNDDGDAETAVYAEGFISNLRD